MFSELPLVLLISGEQLRKRSCVLVNCFDAAPPCFGLDVDVAKKIEILKLLSKARAEGQRVFGQQANQAICVFPDLPT